MNRFFRTWSLLSVSSRVLNHIAFPASSSDTASSCKESADPGLEAVFSRDGREVNPFGLFDETRRLRVALR